VAKILKGVTLQNKDIEGLTLRIAETEPNESLFNETVDRFLLTASEWKLVQKAGARIQEEAERPKALNAKERAQHATHDQNLFTAEDLAWLWRPMSRSTIYKILASLPETDVVIPVGLSRPKIDTVKRYKRKYRTFYVTRKIKERLEAQMRLPVGGKA